MKLRLKGRTLRLRVTRSELAKLQAGERVEETVLFPSSPVAALSYALEVSVISQPMHVAFSSNQILVTLSEDKFRNWCAEDQVGVYATLAVTETTDLEVAIEKDFACLDLSDADNEDTFANPLAGTAC